MNLEITNKILRCEKYIGLLSLIQRLEKDRPFCCHNIEHFLSVARITLIMCHEQGIEVDADIVYSAALLHDIGRADEYLNGTPHEEAGSLIASDILDNVKCNGSSKNRILKIIFNHRDTDGTANSVENIFSRADKKSRLCFCCPASEQCNWNPEKRNMNIEV